MVRYASCRTPDEFDRGYANRITPVVVERWEAFFRERSRSVLDSAAPREELAYGPHPRQRMDLFRAPNAAPDAPVLIALHGGLWFLFDRWMMHALVPAFTAAGIHVVCPGYRLAPEHSLGTIVEDCRSAVRHLRQTAPTLGLDPSRLNVLGHSAAGQLAALTAGTRDLALRRWIGVGGFYDIEPFALTNFQDSVRFSSEDYADHNPLRHAHAGMPPGLLILGARESELLHEMADHYAARLSAAGATARVRDLSGECHFSALAALGDPAKPIHREALAWLRA